MGLLPRWLAGGSGVICMFFTTVSTGSLPHRSTVFLLQTNSLASHARQCHTLTIGSPPRAETGSGCQQQSCCSQLCETIARGKHNLESVSAADSELQMSGAQTLMSTSPPVLSIVNDSQALVLRLSCNHNIHLAF